MLGLFALADGENRIVTAIHFNRGKVYVRHVLTHWEYDRGTWKEY